MPASEIADDMLDASALVLALQRNDAEALEVILGNGDAAGIALILGAHLAVAMSRLDAEDQAVIVGGWREDAARLRRPRGRARW